MEILHSPVMEVCERFKLFLGQIAPNPYLWLS